MHCTRLVLEMFDFYLKHKKYGLYNTNSIKYTMLCAAAQRDSVTLERIYDKLSANLYTRTSPFTQPPTSAPCCRSTT